MKTNRTWIGSALVGFLFAIAFSALLLAPLPSVALLGLNPGQVSGCIARCRTERVATSDIR